MSVQDTYKIHVDPAELPEAEIVESNVQHDGRSCLVLRVRIKGQDR